MCVFQIRLQSFEITQTRSVQVQTEAGRGGAHLNVHDLLVQFILPNIGVAVWRKKNQQRTGKLVHVCKRIIGGHDNQQLSCTDHLDVKLAQRGYNVAMLFPLT